MSTNINPPISVFSKLTPNVRFPIAKAIRIETHNGIRIINAIPVTSISPFVDWALTAFLRSVNNKRVVNQLTPMQASRYVSMFRVV